LDTFLQAMATARIQRFDKYSSSGSSYFSGYSGTCNEGYGVSCTDQGNFAIFKYGTSELASQSTCHADTRESVSDNLQQLNNDLHAGAKCVQIYSASVQGSSIDTSDVSGTAISLLSYSTACTLEDPVSGCPDPYAKLKINEKMYRRASTLHNKTREFRLRLFKSFCLLAFGAAMIYFAYRIYKREGDYVEYDRSIFQRYFRQVSNPDQTQELSTGQKTKKDRKKSFKGLKKKLSSRAASPAFDKKAERSLIQPERNDKSNGNDDDGDGGYYAAMEAGDAPNIMHLSSARTSEGKEEVYDGPEFNEAKDKSVLVPDLDDTVEHEEEDEEEIDGEEDEEEEEEEEDEDEDEDDIEKVTGVPSLKKRRRQGMGYQGKRRDEANWNVFEAAIRRLANRRRRKKHNDEDNDDRAEPLLDGDNTREIQMTNVKAVGLGNDHNESVAISTPTRSAQVAKRKTLVKRIGMWMKHNNNNKEGERGSDETYPTVKIEIAELEENSNLEKTIESKAVPVEELVAQDEPESTPEKPVDNEVVESNPEKLVDNEVVESNPEKLVDNRTTIDGTASPNTNLPMSSIAAAAATAALDQSDNTKSVEQTKEMEKIVQPVSSVTSKELIQSNSSNIWGGVDSRRSSDSVVKNTTKVTMSPAQASAGVEQPEVAIQKAGPVETPQSISPLAAAVGAVTALATSAIGMPNASVQRSPNESLVAETPVVGTNNRGGTTSPRKNIHLTSIKSEAETAVVSADSDSDTDTNADQDVTSGGANDFQISPASSTVSYAGSFQESTGTHDSSHSKAKQLVEQQRPKREIEVSEKKEYSNAPCDVSYAPSLDESYLEQPIKTSYVTILPPQASIPKSSSHSVQNIQEFNSNIPVANKEVELRGQPSFCGASSSEDSNKTGQNQNAQANVADIDEDREDASQVLYQSSFLRDSSDISENVVQTQREQSSASKVFAPLSGFTKFRYPRKVGTDMSVASKVKESIDSNKSGNVRSYVANLKVDPEISTEIDDVDFNKMTTPKTKHVTPMDFLSAAFSSDSSEANTAKRSVVASKSNRKTTNPGNTTFWQADDSSTKDDVESNLNRSNSFMSNVLPNTSWSIANPFKGLALAIASADAAEAVWNATKIKELVSIQEQEEEVVSADSSSSKTPTFDDMQQSLYGGDLLNALEDALSPNASFDGDRVAAPTSTITDDDGDAPLQLGLFQSSTDFLESALAMMPKMMSRTPSVPNIVQNPSSPRRASFTVSNHVDVEKDENDCERSVQSSPYNLQTGFSKSRDYDAMPGVEVEIDEEELSHAPPVREIRRTGSNDVMSLISYEYSYLTEDDNTTLKSRVKSRVHDDRDTQNEERQKKTTTNVNINESREDVEATGIAVDVPNGNTETPTTEVSSKPPLYKSKSIFNKMGFGRKNKA
jgi:hypothetical protein